MLLHLRNFLGLCKTDRQTNTKSWQAAVFRRLLIHRRAGLGTLAQSLGRMLAVADRVALLNAPDSASRRLLLINPTQSLTFDRVVMPLTGTSACALSDGNACCGCVLSNSKWGQDWM